MKTPLSDMSGIWALVKSFWMQSGALLQYDWFFTEEGDKEPTVCISTAAFFILFLFILYYLRFRCVC